MWKIKLNEPIVREMVIKRLFELGVKTYTSTTYNQFCEEWPDQSEWVYCFVDKNLYFDSWINAWLGREEKNYPTLTLDQLFSEGFKLKKEKKIIKINLNPDYNAEISKDGMKVGCHELIPLNIIKAICDCRCEIEDAIEEVENS